MLLFSLAVEKVKMIDQCVTFLHTALGHSFYSLWGCPSISYVLRGNIFWGCVFPFPAWLAFNCFFVVRRLSLPAKRFIRLTGKSSYDMSDASCHRICLKYSHCHHRNHFYNPHIQSHYPERSPQGLASNLEVTMMPGEVLPHSTYTGMCRPTWSWFWISWSRTGYPV